MKHFLVGTDRISVLLFFALIYSSLLILGLFNIQVVQGEKYAVAADRQHWAGSTVLAKRGEIYSRDGYVLATNKISYELYAEPLKIVSPIETAEKIISILGLEKTAETVNFDEHQSERTPSEKEAVVLGHLTEVLSTKLDWVSLYHRITEEQQLTFKQQQIDGLGFREETHRYYPEGSLAAHVLGFVGSDYRGGTQGYYGIEGYYDGDLRGADGEIYQEQTARGEPLLVGGYRRVPAVDGRELHLTLDRTIQAIIEKHLQAGVEHYDALSGSVVVLDPQTGALLALANYPAFDPNNPFLEEKKQLVSPQEEDVAVLTIEPKRPSQERRNLAIAATYEPGSIIKPFTVAAALALQKVTPTTTVYDNGKIFTAGYEIDNWDGVHHGEISVVDILILSDNVGSAQIGKMVGAVSLYDYFSNFGLGTITGVDLEGEDTGLLKDPSVWRELDLMTAAFGQGFSATPLQLTTAFGVFANRGVLMKPYVVESVVESGLATEFPPEEITRVLPEEIALTVQDMLVKAAEAGEAKFYNIRNYTIAGKTGTAQIAEAGKYLKDKTNASFVGYLPKEPKFVLLVKLEKPTASVYAAETAVPLWMDITKDLIIYFGIRPDK